MGGLVPVGPVKPEEGEVDVPCVLGVRSPATPVSRLCVYEESRECRP